MKHLWLLFMFIAYVRFPFGFNKVYMNVKEYELLGEMIALKLTDNTTTVVPAMWTVIEEVKK